MLDAYHYSFELLPIHCDRCGQDKADFYVDEKSKEHLVKYLRPHEKLVCWSCIEKDMAVDDVIEMLKRGK